MADVMNAMFDDLRAQRPPVYDADRWSAWLASLAQVVQAMPRFEQRWALVALLANDVVRAVPGVPVGMAFRSLAPQLLTEADCRQLVKVPE